jgi:four helix bundle protein
MGEMHTEFEDRTTDFALRILRLFSALPKTTAAQVLGKQVLRSGTSVGAHVAEANHSRSAADFINKIQGARQELQETLYWITLIERAGMMRSRRLQPLVTEANEIKAILLTMSSKARRRLTKQAIS